MSVFSKARGRLLLGLLGAIAVGVAGFVSTGGTAQAGPGDSSGCFFPGDDDGSGQEECLPPTARIVKTVSTTSTVLGGGVTYTITVTNDADAVGPSDSDETFGGILVGGDGDFLQEDLNQDGDCFDFGESASDGDLTTAAPGEVDDADGFCDRVVAGTLNALPMENISIIDDVDTELGIGSATWLGTVDFIPTGGNATITGNHVQLDINPAVVGCGGFGFGACHLHDVDVSGDFITLTIAGTAVSCGISANTARVTATGTSAVATAPGVAVACEDLVLTKTGPTEVPQGQTAEYVITVTNNGTLQADDVVVVDQLPTGMEFVGTSWVGASVSGSTVTVQLGDLPAGALAASTKSFTITVKAQGPCDSNQTNTATATTATDFEADTANNTGSVTTKITCAPPAEEGAGPVVPTGDSGLLATSEGSLAGWQMALLSLLAVSALGGAYYGFRRISR